MVLITESSLQVTMSGRESEVNGEKVLLANRTDQRRKAEFSHLWTAIWGLPTLQEKERIHFTDALSHTSILHQNVQAQITFQRREWLGDAVLSFIVSQLLFARFEDYDEEKLSRMRTRIVREVSLATYVRSVNLDKLVHANTAGDAIDDAILADSFESLLGAVFAESENKDVGLYRASKICTHLVDFTVSQADLLVSSFKATLHEWSRAALNTEPIYTTVEVGVPGPNRFHSSVTVGTLNAEGYGPSKQRAEEEAATSIFRPPVPVKSYKGEFSEHEAKTILFQCVVRDKLDRVDIQVSSEPGTQNAPFRVRLSIPSIGDFVEAGGMTRKEAETEAVYRMLGRLRARGHAIPNSIQKSNSILEAVSPSSHSQPTESYSQEEEEEEDIYVYKKKASDETIFNPKGRLQEVIVKASGGFLQPDKIRYVLVEKRGQDHTPEFVVDLSVSGEPQLRARGKGLTKRSAEEDAARQVLTILLNRSNQVAEEQSRESEPGNPIGMLYELLTVNGVPGASRLSFDFSKTDTLFVCRASIDGMQKGQGVAPSKKQAKRIAAEQALASVLNKG